MAYRPRLVRSAYGGASNGNVFEYPEETSQTFVKGNFVELDDDEVQACTGDTNNSCVGIALQDASGTDDTLILVQRLIPGDILSMHLTSAGTDATPATATHIGNAYGIVRHGTDTDVDTVDAAETTDAWFKVVGIDKQKSANCVLVEWMGDDVRGMTAEADLDV